MTGLFSLALLTTALLAAAPAGAQHSGDDTLAQQLRQAYFGFDFEGGVLLAESAPELSTSREAGAWYLLNLARYRAAEDAVGEARQFLSARPEDAWAWFALAGTLHRLDEDSTEALEASERALALRPDDPDFQYLHAELLRMKEGPEAALSFIDDVFRASGRTANLLVSKARAFYESSGDYTPAVDTTLIDAAFAAYAEARALDPANVAAHFNPAELLSRKRRNEEAWPLFERASALSPLSGHVQQEYLHAVQARDDLSEEEIRALVVERVEDMLRERGEVPDLLYKAAHLFGDVKLYERQREMQDRLLEVEPRGGRAEWTHLNRIRAFKKEHREQLGKEDGDLALKKKYREMLRAFVDRDWHVKEGLLGEAYLNLFSTADSSTSTDELVDLVDGMVRHEKLNPHITYRSGPMELAERGRYRDAERVARAGFDPWRAQVDQRRDRYDEEEYARRLRGVDAMLHDVLGWIYLLEGRLDDAERELSRAYDLTEGRGHELQYHLGRLYETRYDRARSGEAASDGGTLSADPARETLYATAFRYYQEGSRAQTRGDNPNEAALRALYRKHNGSLDGYEAFLASDQDEEAAERKRRVLDGRLSEPRALQAFRMKRLDGNELSSDELVGKVVVINAWYTGCGPCVWEMPDLQELYDRYRDEPDVLVLTVNKDQVPDEARKWLAEKGLTLPALIDDGYLDRMKVWAYPTTWFVDREGNIAFEQVGWSKHLVEEFSWRIEALR